MVVFLLFNLMLFVVYLWFLLLWCLVNGLVVGLVVFILFLDFGVLIARLLSGC